MRTQRSWLWSGLATALVVALSSVTFGQGYPYPAPQGMVPPGYPLPPGVPAGPAPTNPYAPPAPYGAVAPAPMAAAMPPGAMLPGPMGMPVVPAGYMAGPQGGPTGPAMGEGPMMGACPNCGGMGCPLCIGDPASEDFDVRILRWLLPYGAGGIAEPRWYDIYADVLYLERNEVSRVVNFMSSGISGPIALSSDSMSFNDEYGFRVGGAIQIGNGNALEAHYMGTFNWDARAQVTDAGGNLFSAFSDFGTSPFNGFDDSDGATFASIAYGTTFHSVEMNYRQRWMAPNPRVQGSWLYGARFFELSEGFEHRITGRAGSTNYQIGTYNALIGFQVGGDGWLTIIPGLRVGGEAKVGIYGNRAKQGSTIVATSIANPVIESAKSRSVAFLGEAQLEAIWRISHRWTFRAGYEFLYVDGVALAIENFNSGPPFVAGQRTVSINDNGDVFYHGGFLGLEWIW